MKAKNNVMRAFCFMLIAIITLSIMPISLFDAVAKAQTKAMEIAEIYISNVNITPISGDTPKDATFFTIPDDAPYTVSIQGWYNETDGKYMDSSSLFEDDKKYTFGWTFNAKYGCTFTEETKVLINGSYTNIDEANTYINGYDDTKFFVWSAPSEAVAVSPQINIDTIIIFDANITAVAGKTAGESLNYSLPEYAPYTVTFTTWFDDAAQAYMNNTDFFQKDKRYSRGWDIQAKDGCTFTADTKVLINGSNSNVDLSYTKINNSDSTIFNVWTITNEAAAESQKIIIDTINIDYANITPMVGKTAGESLDYSSSAYAPYTVTFTTWFDDAAQAYMNSTDLFEEGKKYSRGWDLKAKDGYTFTEDTKVLINGSDTDIDSYYTRINSSDSTIFSVWTNKIEAIDPNAKIEIDTINISNANITPIIGKTAGEILDYTLPEDAPYTVTFYGWYNNTDRTNMYSDSVFESGKRYSFSWNLKANEGYAFTEATNVLINESDTNINAANTGMSLSDNTVFFISTIPAEAIGVSEKITINSIDIFNANITPIIDKTAGESLACTLPETAPYTIAFFNWYNDTDQTYMQSDSVFEAGKKYSLKWNLQANDGYVFAENPKVRINGSEDIINETCTYINASDNTLFYVWTISTEAVAEIKEINILDADITPIAGKTAGESLAYTLPDDAPYTVIDHSWYCSTDDKSMNDNDVFEAGKKYSFTWTLEANEKYTFAKDAKVYINSFDNLIYEEWTYMDEAETTIFYVCSISTVAVEQPKFALGDVNLDGKVNTGDAVMILRQIAGAVTFTEEQTALADFNKDGKVNTGDAVAILKFCVGIKSDKLYIK